jgi:hypothetical protein
MLGEETRQGHAGSSNSCGDAVGVAIQRMASCVRPITLGGRLHRSVHQEAAWSARPPRWSARNRDALAKRDVKGSAEGSQDAWLAAPSRTRSPAHGHLPLRNSGASRDILSWGTHGRPKNRTIDRLHHIRLGNDLCGDPEAGAHRGPFDTEDPTARFRCCRLDLPMDLQPVSL